MTLERPRIALQVPYSDSPGKFFSFRLQTHLNEEPSAFVGGGRIVAISDIGGDFYALQNFLIKNGIISRVNHQWIFGDGHLVVVGDCSDGDKEAVECLWLLYSLEEKARAVGGYVHFILGNNEIANIRGSWRNEQPRYAKLTGSMAQGAILFDGNNELGRWLHTKNIIEKIGKTLFVHGGISPLIVESGLSLSEINTQARNYYIESNEVPAGGLTDIIFNTKDSPIRYRGYYKDVVEETIIDASLEKFGVSTIVTGHTKVGRVSAYFGGKVVNINASGRNSKISGLLIEEQVFFKVNNVGDKERLLTEC